MKIGLQEYKYGIFLAPMAGVTDKAFRHICKKYGAEGLTTEMISSRALIYNDKNTVKLAHIDEFEKPCALQLFGNEPEAMAKAAYLALKYEPCAIDINMGCPTPKIVNNGDGSALMKNPDLCEKIVSAVFKQVGNIVPVTTKIRLGFDEKSINCIEVAKACEQGGASAVTLHARTRKQMYAPPVYPEYISLVKKNISIPLIGNGDITTPYEALEMMKNTGCDGVMIGRGALGNPYIFENIRRLMDNKQLLIPSNETLINDIKEHFSMLLEDKGEFTAVREARKHIAWYIKGRPGSAALRDKVNRALNKEEILYCVYEAFSD